MLGKTAAVVSAQNLPSLNRHMAQVGQAGLNPGSWSNFWSRIRPKSGPGSGGFRQTWPMLANLGPALSQDDYTSSQLGPYPANIRQSRSCLVKSVPKIAPKHGPALADLGLKLRQTSASSARPACSCPRLAGPCAARTARRGGVPLRRRVHRHAEPLHAELRRRPPPRLSHHRAEPPRGARAPPPTPGGSHTARRSRRPSRPASGRAANGAQDTAGTGRVGSVRTSVPAAPLDANLSPAASSSAGCSEFRTNPSCGRSTPGKSRATPLRAATRAFPPDVPNTGKRHAAVLRKRFGELPPHAH